jgi:hypothetical protein
MQSADELGVVRGMKARLLSTYIQIVGLLAACVVASIRRVPVAAVLCGIAVLVLVGVAWRRKRALREMPIGRHEPGERAVAHQVVFWSVPVSTFAVAFTFGVVRSSFLAGLIASGGMLVAWAVVAVVVFLVGRLRRRDGH